MGDQLREAVKTTGWGLSRLEGQVLKTYLLLSVNASTLLNPAIPTTFVKMSYRKEEGLLAEERENSKEMEWD